MLDKSIVCFGRNRGYVYTINMIKEVEKYVNLGDADIRLDRVRDSTHFILQRLPLCCGQ